MGINVKIPHARKISPPMKEKIAPHDPFFRRMQSLHAERNLPANRVAGRWENEVREEAEAVGSLGSGAGWRWHRWSSQVRSPVAGVKLLPRRLRCSGAERPSSAIGLPPEKKINYPVRAGLGERLRFARAFRIAVVPVGPATRRKMRGLRFVRDFRFAVPATAEPFVNHSL